VSAGASDIPFSRPSLGAEEEQAVIEVLRSGWIVGGRVLAEFENEFAARCEAAYAVGVSSWTTGAFLVLKCWNIGEGDEVIVPSLTFIATVNVIRHVGATPIFADIDPNTWTISPDDVARRITSRTKAIFPVDQLGMPCDLPALSTIAARHDLRLLDDAACAFGSCIGSQPIGSFGSATVFSLHARKVITTGEGGMILTNDKGLSDRLRRLRHQGMSLSDFSRHGNRPTQFETYDETGYNFRMTDIQAAIGLQQLARANQMLARRAVLAQQYTTQLQSSKIVIPPTVPQGMKPNWQSYQVSLRSDAGISRDMLMNKLFDRGIHVRRGVMAAHLETVYAGLGNNLPFTEHAASSTLQLPIYPDLTDEQQQRVVDALREFR